MQYYNLKRNWTKKIVPHLDNKDLNRILVRDFRKFTYGAWDKEFTHGQFPRDFENCDWWWEYKGPEPRFWKYVKHSACHWLVNFTLKLAQLAEPNREWRIITSDKHSTVWDGKDTIFDFNFYAFNIPVEETFELANKKELPPGKERKVYYPPHYTTLMRRP